MINLLAPWNVKKTFMFVVSASITTLIGICFALCVSNGGFASGGQLAPRLSPVADPAFGDSIQCPPLGLTMDGQVIRVIDGDTIVVRSYVEYHVRLLDCWAPESRTRDLEEKGRGLKSKARMIELASEKSVRVNLPHSSADLTKLITMGRLLGRVWLIEDGSPEDLDLSSRMVLEGFATKTKGGE
jgi:endonuclease YncB( thermonuclease family)